MWCCGQGCFGTVHRGIEMRTLLLLLVMLPLTGCSVGMALSGEEDPDLSVLRVGASRGQVEMELGTPAAEILGADGYTYATYAYTVGNEPSAGRAVAHGVMDVLTLGLWEVVGTPVEAAAGKENEHAVVVVYDRNGMLVAVNQAARREDETAVEEGEKVTKPLASDSP